MNGDDATSYELYMDQGEVNSVFSEVVTYSLAGGSDATALTHQITTLDDGLEAGKIYSVKFRALNVAGPSQFSDLLRVAVAD